MKELPILFSTPMVQAILEGRKSMTRRICKHQHWSFTEVLDVNVNKIFQRVDRNVSCPYGEPGDLLWVRETYRKPEGELMYKADFPEIPATKDFLTNEEIERFYWKWKPSIFMPKEAARIWLKITNVRVERLQDISDDDAEKEGVKMSCHGKVWLNYIDQKSGITQFIYNCFSPKESFFTLWDLINGKESRLSNPWVWVVEFERIK